MDSKTLLTKIYLEGIEYADIQLKDDEIVWTDIFGVENYISKFNIASNNGICAWYETNDVGNDKVKINLKDNIIVVWSPPINSMGFSWGGCNFFQFYGIFLIVSYHDKHGDVLNFINLNTFDVQRFSFDGFRKKIEMFENEILVNELFKSREQKNYKLTVLETEIIKETV